MGCISSTRRPARRSAKRAPFSARRTAKDLRAVFFSNGQTGTAAGADGTILRTTTGGRLSSVAQIGDARPAKALPGDALAQNHPNPATGATIITFTVVQAGEVHLDVLDPLGRRVALLVQETMEPGRYRVTFDTQGLPSGTYSYRLRTALGVQTRRLVILR